MKLRAGGLLVLVLVVALLAAPLAAEAQQVARVYRIGFLMASSPSAVPTRVEAFRRGLHALGYVEGSNLIMELRSAEGKFDRLPALAAQLVSLKVDVSSRPVPWIHVPPRMPPRRFRSS